MTMDPLLLRFLATIAAWALSASAQTNSGEVNHGGGVMMDMAWVV
jgi:hypothetical protein